MSTEELRQNVFSSIHMSTLARSVQASITYPSCTFCGGALVGGSTRSAPKRKTALCQLSLYTNSSESFVVWYKKQDEPKGMLWMRTCCIRKGSDDNCVELISRGCRGRCSYTLKFSSAHTSDDWYKMLKQESRKIPSLGDELLSNLDEGYLESLDSMLTDTSPLSVLNEVLYGGSSDEDDSENQPESSETQDQVAPLNHPASSTPTSKPLRSNKTPKSKTVKSKLKSSPVICNPLQGLSTKSKKAKDNIISTSTSFSSSSVGSVSTNPLESIENSFDASRWSWPMKA